MEKTPTEWNPLLYLKFSSERAQPSLDLVSRIDLEYPHRILDVGCGPGNSTQILAARWPGARITGIDSSKAMIAQAQSVYPHGDWRVADAGTFHSREMFDIIFANAVIHWIPDHEALLKHLLGLTNQNGCLAVQMPLTSEMKIAELIESAFKSAGGNRGFDINRHIHTHSVEFYMNVLGALPGRFDAWTTTYFHRMDSAGEIYSMMSSTRMRPYLDQLRNERQQEEFKRMLTDAIDSTYTRLDNGKIIFPFKRFFLLVHKD